MRVTLARYCRRCGGNLYYDKDGWTCLQCGTVNYKRRGSTILLSDAEVVSIAKQMHYVGDLYELKLGIENEYQEHVATLRGIASVDPLFASAGIAIDHLREDSHYYSKARKVNN